MILRIISVCSCGGGDAVEVCIECTDDGGINRSRERFVISPESCAELAVCRGDCTTDMYDAIAYAADLRAALRRAAAIIGSTACSERALRQKLIAKGVSREIADEAVSKIAAKGLINTAADATREARRMADKLWGERRIYATLAQKGYGSEDIRQALCALEDDGIDYTQSCRELIEKRYAKEAARPAMRQKLVCALLRFGYTQSQIRAALLK